MSILILVFLAINNILFGYEKIDFIGSITDKNIQNVVSVISSDEKIFALSENAVYIYDSSFTFNYSFNLKTNKNIAITYGDKIIYTLDYSIPLISAYNEKGEFLFSFGSSKGKTGALSSPGDIKYFKDGKIYVANTKLSRIEVFDKNGIYLYGFNTVKSDGITKVKPIKICLDNSGFIYITEPDKPIIQKYDRLGRLIIEKEIRANAISVNDFGVVYIGDEKEGKVKELNEKLEVIKPFGTKGKGKFEFLSFTDLFVNSKNQLLILDKKNAKLLAVELENSNYKQKLPEHKNLDKIMLLPKDNLRISPFSFAVSNEGTVFYYDKQLKAGYKLEKDTKKQIFSYGENEGQVNDPSNIVYSNEKIYICDTGNSRIDIFDKEGKYLSYFGGKASFFEKNKEGKFNSPLSLTLDQKENVYVADTGNSMVQIFNKDGIFLLAIGPTIGNFKMTKIQDIKVDEENKLYILDSELKKIIISDTTGKYISFWDISNLEEPVSFDYDGYGYFYILDKKNSRVNVYDKNGNYQVSFFTSGPGDRELNEATLLKIVKGNLYISDPTGNKLAIYSISYIPPTPASLSAKANEEKIDISWQIENPKLVKEYEIYRGKNKDEINFIAKTTELSWSDNKLENDTTYYYKVSAISVTGKKSSSEFVSVYFQGKKEIETQLVKTEEPSKNKPPVEIISADLKYIFSANYKYYLKNPLGRIYIQNNTSEKFNNVKVSFFLKEYMDFPSDFIIPELLPMSSAYVDLKATLNNKILTISEDTPVQAQFSVSYYRDEKENSFQLNQPIKILSRNAITWDNTERIANFITIKDPMIDSFSKFMLAQKSDFENETRIDPNLLSLVIIWENLSAYGLSYVPDPVNPYASIKSSSNFITDTVQFPRNTLKLKSGDCDDLTVLLATFLESAGIRVMILDYPGHIALMAEMQANEKSEVGLPDELIISYENRYFVPIETTMIGKNLYDSITYAANMYKQNKDEVKIVDLRKAMTKFEPVTLPDTQETIKNDIPGLKEKIAKTLEYISNKKFEYYENFYKMAIKENPQDFNSLVNLGILYAENKKFDEAKKIFEELSQNNDSALAFNNLGNVYFLEGNYSKAIDNYMKASKIDPFDEGIFFNIARAHLKLGNKENAKIFIERALKINPEAKDIANEILK